jgi:hypothetical protein
METEPAASGRPALDLAAKMAADDLAVLAHMARYPGLTAFETARALHWATDRRFADAGRVRRAAGRLEETGLLAHVDRPKSGGPGWRRTYHTAPGGPGPGQTT